MKKSKLQNYYVKLFIVVTYDNGLSSCGVVSFDSYEENELNAVLDVMKYINLDVIIRQRAKQVNYDDSYTWYGASEYIIIKVEDVSLIDN